MGCDLVDPPILAGRAIEFRAYLAVRAGNGGTITTPRLATSDITKAHEWGRPRGPLVS